MELFSDNDFSLHEKEYRPTVPLSELNKFATKYFKEKGYIKKGLKWIKKQGDFINCLFIQNSKSGYYVRPYVGITKVIEELNKEYNCDMMIDYDGGNFGWPNIYIQLFRETQIKNVAPQTIDDILGKVEQYFDEWNNKVLILKRIQIHETEGVEKYYSIGGVRISQPQKTIKYILSQEFVAENW